MKDLDIRRDFELMLKKNPTDFILVQKGKGHYNIVGYEVIHSNEGDTALILKLGKRIEH